MVVDGGPTSSQDDVGEEPEVSSVFRPTTLEPHPFSRGDETIQEYVQRLIHTLPSFVRPQETTASVGRELSATAPPVLPVPSQETFFSPPPPNPAMPPSVSPQGITVPAVALPLSSLELTNRNAAPPLNHDTSLSIESSTDSSQMPPLSLSPSEISSSPSPVNYPSIVPYSNFSAGSLNRPPWIFIPTPPSQPPPSPIDPPYSSQPVETGPMIPETPPPPTQQDQDQDNRHGGGRAAPTQVKSEVIEQPYPWASTRRARIQTMQYMKSNQINFIRGKFHCLHCCRVCTVVYDLRQKVIEVCAFIATGKRDMNGEAPDVWMNPVFPDCWLCGKRNGAEPFVIGRKRNINWLFLFLGQMLGYLELSQLRYFCKHTGNPQDSADKPRVLYLTYVGLYKQLFPYVPLDL